MAQEYVSLGHKHTHSCSIRIRILVGQEHVSELLRGVWMHQEGAEMAFYSLFCLYFKRF